MKDSSIRLGAFLFRIVNILMDMAGCTKQTDPSMLDIFSMARQKDKAFTFHQMASSTMGTSIITTLRE